MLRHDKNFPVLSSIQIVIESYHILVPDLIPAWFPEGLVKNRPVVYVKDSRPIFL